MTEIIPYQEPQALAGFGPAPLVRREILFRVRNSKNRLTANVRGLAVIALTITMLTLVLRSIAGARDADPYSIGVTLISSAGCPVFVGSVLTKSPAERAGIRAGDQVISVEGVRVRALRDASKLLRSDQPAQLSVRLTRDGGEYELILDREKRSTLYRNAGKNIISGVIVSPDTTQAEVDRMLAFDGRRLVGRLFPTHYPRNPELFYGGFEIFVLRDPAQVTIGGIEEGPAAVAGLHWGDELLAVNGTSTSGKAETELESMLSARQPATVHLQIDRLGSIKNFDLPLEKAKDVARRNGKRFVDGEIVPLWAEQKDLHCFLPR